MPSRHTRQRQRIRASESTSSVSYFYTNARTMARERAHGEVSGGETSETYHVSGTSASAGSSTRYHLLLPLIRQENSSPAWRFNPLTSGRHGGGGGRTGSGSAAAAASSSEEEDESSPGSPPAPTVAPGERRSSSSSSPSSPESVADVMLESVVEAASLSSRSGEEWRGRASAWSGREPPSVEPSSPLGAPRFRSRSEGIANSK